MIPIFSAMLRTSRLARFRETRIVCVSSLWKVSLFWRSRRQKYRFNPKKVWMINCGHAITNVSLTEMFQTTTVFSINLFSVNVIIESSFEGSVIAIFAAFLFCW